MPQQRVISTSLRRSISVVTLVFLSAIFILYSSAREANIVDLDASCGWPDDTLYSEELCEFQIWMENDFVLGGMSLGYKVWSPDGATWIWDRICDNGKFACPEFGSRADDPEIFDMTGLLITEQDVDGASPDYFMLGGVAMINGLPTGPLDHLYSAYFHTMFTGEGLYTICIDSTFIPPSGAFVFVDPYGAMHTPTVLWSSGGRCWPVRYHHCYAEWDEGLPAEMSVAHCDTGSVTLSASHPIMPVSFSLYQLSGGYGEAIVIDNGDGTCEVSYAPVPQDVGQGITIKIDADCDGCPASVSLYYLSIIVTTNSPVLDSGFYYCWGATNNPIVKDDIGANDDDACDALEFSIISGPGDIDPVSGVYSWLPGPSDTGTFVVTVEVTDGAASDQGSFEIGVMDESCCPGDANFSGDVNVGDAVMLIAYIFNEGPAPQVPNWADANADCVINVGDVVYLIAYIFNLGPAPQLGCVY